MAWGQARSFMKQTARFEKSVWSFGSHERIWHTQDSQGQMLAVAFSLKSFKTLEKFPLSLKASW